MSELNRKGIETIIASRRELRANPEGAGSIGRIPRNSELVQLDPGDLLGHMIRPGDTILGPMDDIIDTGEDPTHTEELLFRYHGQIAVGRHVEFPDDVHEPTVNFIPQVPVVAADGTVTMQHQDWLEFRGRVVEVAIPEGQATEQGAFSIVRATALGALQQSGELFNPRDVNPAM